jgi:hypothetical protein
MTWAQQQVGEGNEKPEEAKGGGASASSLFARREGARLVGAPSRSCGHYAG